MPAPLDHHAPILGNHTFAATKTFPPVYPLLIIAFCNASFKTAFGTSNYNPLFLCHVYSIAY